MKRDKDQMRFIITLVIVVVIGIFAQDYWIRHQPKPKPKPNPHVHETTFNTIKLGDIETQVRQWIGKPTYEWYGEVVKVERPESTNLQCVIEYTENEADLLNCYCGKNEEDIYLLFSAKTGKLIAKEYLVADIPVMYDGAYSFKNNELRAISAPRRICDLKAEQRKLAEQYIRKHELMRISK